MSATGPNLKEDIDLGGGLVQGFLDGDGHAFYELGQLDFLLIPYHQVLELHGTWYLTPLKP